MTKEKNYKKTLIACYLGFITQAIAAEGKAKPARRNKRLRA